jgi:hypothetical protein
MPLMKSKKWMAYTVALNDLIADYDVIIERFEKSSIPLDELFGSNTEQYSPHSIVMAIGTAIEPSRLRDILKLLENLGPDFIIVDIEGIPHKKTIYIGSYKLDQEEAIPMTPILRQKLLDEQLDLKGMYLILEQSLKVPIIENRKDR